MEDRYIRTAMLLGEPAVEKLKNSHVAVIGLGGVGSWCAEALARCGIGELTLIDQDTVSESNLNRQLCATVSSLGRSKAEALAERIRDVAPGIELHPITARYEAGSRDELLKGGFDMLVDCIDLVSCKLDLIQACRERGIAMISALGTGNKLDAQQLRITDISKTSGCALARVMRRELRRLGIDHHPVVFSPEEPMEPKLHEAPPPGRRSVPGSIVWVPATAGLLLCQYVVDRLASESEGA